MPKWKKSKATAMRRRPTPGEYVLWQHLRERGGARGRPGIRPLGVRFRRQVPMLGYIADFYAPKGRLVVEVDGDSHAGQEQYDRARDLAMAERGLVVLRVTEQDVMRNVLGVVVRIQAQLTAGVDQTATAVASS